MIEAHHVLDVLRSSPWKTWSLEELRAALGTVWTPAIQTIIDQQRLRHVVLYAERRHYSFQTSRVVFWMPTAHAVEVCHVYLDEFERLGRERVSTFNTYNFYSVLRKWWWWRRQSVVARSKDVDDVDLLRRAEDLLW